jgi:hypothetical protein
MCDHTENQVILYMILTDAVDCCPSPVSVPSKPGGGGKVGH